MFDTIMLIIISGEFGAILVLLHLRHEMRAQSARRNGGSLSAVREKQWGVQPGRSPEGPREFLMPARTAPAMPGVNMEAVVMPADGVSRPVTMRDRNDVSFHIDRVTDVDRRVTNLNLQLDPRTVSELGPVGCHDLQHAICGAAARMLSEALSAAEARKSAAPAPEGGTPA